MILAQLTRWPFAAALIGALLLGPLPVHGRVSTPPPDVDLDALRVTGDGAEAPYAGGTASLTIVPELQHAGARLLALAAPQEGGIVLIEASNGRVLMFNEYRRGSTSGGAVLRSARAPAASVFKLVTTAALLERRVDPKERVCIEGGKRRIEPRHLLPARGADARCAPFREALGHSRNAVFAQLAARHLDPELLADMAGRLGFGQNVPFDVPVPVGRFDVAEGELGFARTAAGFVGSTLSPLGAAHLAYTIALHGRPATLHIVERAGDYEAPARRHLLARVFHESVALELRRMMEVTVHSGTSLSAFTDDEGRSYLGSLRVAGKTGTLPGGEGTTSWFAGFAPSRNPRVVVAVLLRNGVTWRRKANEVARDVLRAYFARHGYRGVTSPFAAD